MIPTHNIFTVIDTGKAVEGKDYTKKIWHKIGVGWEDEPSMIRLQLMSLPINNSLEIRPIVELEEKT